MILNAIAPDPSPQGKRGVSMRSRSGGSQVQDKDAETKPIDGRDDEKVPGNEDASGVDIGTTEQEVKNRKSSPGKGVAELSKASSRKKRKIEDELECAICMDQLAFTHTTRCGHSYCYECIHDVWSSQCSSKQPSASKARSSAAVTVPCPSCMEPFILFECVHSRAIDSVIESMLSADDDGTPSEELSAWLARKELGQKMKKSQGSSNKKAPQPQDFNPVNPNTNGSFLGSLVRRTSPARSRRNPSPALLVPMSHISLERHLGRNGTSERITIPPNDNTSTRAPRGAFRSDSVVQPNPRRRRTTTERTTTERITSTVDITQPAPSAPSDSTVIDLT